MECYIFVNLCSKSIHLHIDLSADENRVFDRANSTALSPAYKQKLFGRSSYHHRYTNQPFQSVQSTPTVLTTQGERHEKSTLHATVLEAHPLPPPPRVNRCPRAPLERCQSKPCIPQAANNWSLIATLKLEHTNWSTSSCSLDLPRHFSIRPILQKRMLTSEVVEG